MPDTNRKIVTCRDGARHIAIAIEIDSVVESSEYVNGIDSAEAAVRLNQRGRGILLLHDVQPVTALALPALLQQLKASGYRVVHVVGPHAAHVAAGQPQASPRKRGRAIRESEWHSTPPEARGWQYFRR